MLVLIKLDDVLKYIFLSMLQRAFFLLLMYSIFQYQKSLSSLSVSLGFRSHAFVFFGVKSHGYVFPGV